MKLSKKVKLLGYMLCMLIYWPLSVFASQVVLGIGEYEEDDNTLAIFIDNREAVRGIQCTLRDLPDTFNVVNVKTTERTKNFFVQYNDLGKKGVKIILVNLADETISPGNGPILKVKFNKKATLLKRGKNRAKLFLTQAKVAGINNKPLKVVINNF